MSVTLINFEVRENARVGGNVKAFLPDSTSISSHFTPEYTVLLATFSAPAIQRLAIDCAKKRKREGEKQSNLDCQTLLCCASLMNFYEAKQQHNLPTHNTSEDLWSNKLILRALINL